jgi:hypothetical protein
MNRTTDGVNSEKRSVLSNAGKDAFHSVPLFSRSHAAAFHVLSCDPSSHVQEVRDAVECVPTWFVALIRVQCLGGSFSMNRTTDDLNSEKRSVLPSAGKDAFHSVPLLPRSHALAFHVLSCDPPSHVQEVRDAVECVPTGFMATIRRPIVGGCPWRSTAQLTELNSEKRPVFSNTVQCLREIVLFF